MEHPVILSPGHNVPTFCIYTPKKDSSERPYLVAVGASSKDTGIAVVSALQRSVSTGPQTSVREFALGISPAHSQDGVRTFAIGRSLSSLSAELKKPRATARWKASASSPPSIGYVFTGQGANTYDTGRELLLHSTLFASVIRECDRVLASLPQCPEWAIETEMMRSDKESRLLETRFSQPFSTALQIGLVEILKAWNIQPTAVCGHSSGEIAAAYAAGILSLKAAITIAYYRGLHMHRGLDATRPGAMLSVDLDEGDAEQEIRLFKGRLDIAAVNSPLSVTVSGDADAVSELEKTLTERGVFVRKLRVQQAFHSSHMLPIAASYESALRACSWVQTRPASCRMWSSVTSQRAVADDMGPSYWAENMVRPVRFIDALNGVLTGRGENEPVVNVLIEIGPHPVLKGPAREVAARLGLKIPYIAPQKRNSPAYECVLEAVGQLFLLGCPVDLSSVNTD
jgi:acyl transferase domain-containing protein